MKKIVLIIAALTLSFPLFAQGNSGNKGKNKNKNENTSSNNGNEKGNGNGEENKAKNEEYDLKVWEGVAEAGSDCMKPSSKNQPAKVRAAFQRDYPSASFVRWSKCRGDWTASFNNGLFRSTAVYHANGDRRDTRSYVKRENLPVKIIDIILKRMPGSNADGAIKIEIPTYIKDVFRIPNLPGSSQPFLYFDTDGLEIPYNY